jgi:hypothetical protein
MGVIKRSNENYDTVKTALKAALIISGDAIRILEAMLIELLIEMR